MKTFCNCSFPRLTLLFIFMLISYTGFSQTSTSENETEIYTFEEVDRPPLAKTCKAKWEAERQQACTNEYIRKHLVKNFDTGLGSELEDGIVSLKIRFVINEEGKVVDVSVTGGPDIINEHAIEVASNLPRFEAGIHQEKPVRVQMEIPLRFKITNF